jgi:8-oxo-dGTP diphosphatase
MSNQSQARVRRGVIGVAARGEKLLLIQRAPGIDKGGAWCFPGGHVEHGETPRVAVRREFREELGLEIQPVSRVGAVRVLDSLHVLAIWRVDVTGGVLRPDSREIADVRWLCPSEIRALEVGLPSNEPVLQLLGL